jgi:head-tail adaptor
VGSIVSPLLADRLVTFYPSQMTIQSRTDTRDSYGQPIPAWANVVGLVSLPCRIAAVNADERPGPDKTIVTVTHHTSIAGYYPTITVAMRAVDGGVFYDIVAVEFDSELVTTRLRVKLVST